MENTTELLLSAPVTHDTRRFILSRPEGFTFTPGQGVELAMTEGELAGEGRPFTPTSLADDRVLEFVIKRYDDHPGVTRHLHTLLPGTTLTISEPFGTIAYQGPGVFIAGGAGITPFIAILRDLAHRGALGGHSLIFSNKTPADVICQQELFAYLGADSHFTCTETRVPGYESGRIDQAFLAERIRDFSQQFYVCGPPGFMDGVTRALEALGASPQNLVFER